MLVCLRLLQREDAYNYLEDAAIMGQEKIPLYFQQFCKDISTVYSPIYLNRRPTKDELTKLVRDYKKFEFPGCEDA